MLRAVLGDPHPDFEGTIAEPRTPLAAAMGFTSTELFDDHGLVHMVEAAAPATCHHRAR